MEIERFHDREDKNIVEIMASIICEKTSHKGIVIGKGGRMLKSIGSQARMDIERFLGIKVYLELFVKVRSDWRNNPVTMRDLGYDLKEF